MALEQRLLRDLAELKSKPYPFINWIPHENNIHKACLVLTPENHVPIHLSVTIPHDFPLQPPHISCNTQINHPNIFGHYICATILNTKEGYTPAYTLKAITIQILSFFTSENLEQEDFPEAINLRVYSESRGNLAKQYTCWTCGCNTGKPGDPLLDQSDNIALNHGPDPTAGAIPEPVVTDCPISKLPDEVLALLCEYLEDEALVNFSRAWNKIGGPNGLVSRFNLVRNRDLQCFALKKSFNETTLGVGVRIDGRGRKGAIASEFDLISWEAFSKHHIRTSVHGMPAPFWMPLPISQRHYNRVRNDTTKRLSAIGIAAKIDPPTPAAVIYDFMTDVVVKLSDSTTRSQDQKTTLKHASEKAIESYFHLFHILLCLVGRDESVVGNANTMLGNFVAGQTSKSHCPNLGHLLLAVLISDIDLTQDLLMAIIQETVTRNVVWMLDKNGANMPELAYLEPDKICEYRMSKTFEASKTSYRLLMFFNLFRRTIARGTGPNRKSLNEMRDQLFDAHGAPPFGAAAGLAAQVKNVQEVNDFYAFLKVMDIEVMPTKQELTKFLRNRVVSSVEMGYSVWGISQEAAKALRKAQGDRKHIWVGSFFPDQTDRGCDTARGRRSRRGRG